LKKQKGGGRTAIRFKGEKKEFSQNHKEVKV